MAFISHTLTTEDFATMQELAQTVYRGTGDRARGATRKLVHSIKEGSLDIAPDEKIGSEKRRRLWVLSLDCSRAVFGLPEDSVFIPCYICGHIFDAWTMDTEHVEARHNANRVKIGRPGYVLLSCSECNRYKGEGGQISPSARDMIKAKCRNVMFTRGGPGLGAYWNLRPRRSAGFVQSTLAPSGVLPLSARN